MNPAHKDILDCAELAAKHETTRRLFGVLFEAAQAQRRVELHMLVHRHDERTIDIVRTRADEWDRMTARLLEQEARRLEQADRERDALSKCSHGGNALPDCTICKPRVAEETAAIVEQQPTHDGWAAVQERAQRILDRKPEDEGIPDPEMRAAHMREYLKRVGDGLRAGMSAESAVAAAVPPIVEQQPTRDAWAGFAKRMGAELPQDAVDSALAERAQAIAAEAAAAVRVPVQRYDYCRRPCVLHGGAKHVRALPVGEWECCLCRDEAKRAGNGHAEATHAAK